MENKESESTFVNTDFKNDPELLEWMNQYVASIPDLSRGAYIRHLVRRDMKIKQRRLEQQAAAKPVKA